MALALPRGRDGRPSSHPIAHTDFEQGSIFISGTYVHHLGVRWRSDLQDWRADEAVEVGSRSVVVIPLNVIHTSRNVGRESALLVDLFYPPRLDFSFFPRPVRTADEYSLPDDVSSRWTRNG